MTAALLFAAAVSTASPLPAASPTASPSPAASPMASPSPAASPLASQAPAPNATATPVQATSGSPAAVPSGSPAAGPSGSPAAGPSGSPSATPGATQSPSPAPSPSATPVYKYRVVPSPNPSAANGAPAILEVDLNDKQLTPHGKIAIRVLTSPDVVKVVTRSNGREGPLQQTAPGEFIGNGSIPGIPFIARGWKVNIEFVATTADGRTASVKVPVTLG